MIAISYFNSGPEGTIDTKTTCWCILDTFLIRSLLQVIRTLDYFLWTKYTYAVKKVICGIVQT